MAPKASGEGHGTDVGLATSPDHETELPLQREGPPEVRKRMIFDGTPKWGVGPKKGSKAGSWAHKV